MNAPFDSQRHELRHAFIPQPELWAMQEALAGQEAAGHTAETDAEHSVEYLADKCLELAQLTRARAPLDVAYRRAARAAAAGIALMRRIRLEQSREAREQAR